MSEITIQLPDEDLAFLREYSAAQKMTPEEYLAEQASSLRKYLKRPLHPDVIALTGIIPPNSPVETTYHDYLEEKYR